MWELQLAEQMNSANRYAKAVSLYRQLVLAKTPLDTYADLPEGFLNVTQADKFA